MGEHFNIAIVGSGFSGLGMAIRLKQEGNHDFVVLERGGDVGGTWRDNTYPGCQCDVPSRLYSFSFAQHPGWSRTFSKQPEILDYLRRCAAEKGVLPHIRFDHDVEEAAWDGDAALWRLTTSQGELTADVLVSAVGGLAEPRLPDVPGLERFRGAAFHSAAWDHEHDLSGERVAVVGTGASSIQFIPRVRRQAAHVTVFQRTPPWIMPHSDRPVSRLEQTIYRLLPFSQHAIRTAIFWAREASVVLFTHPPLMRIGEAIARRHLRRQVPDPELRAKLTPRYRMGCKRVLLSNSYLPAMASENVSLVTSGIREVREGSVVAEDGSEHEVDAIIFGTGFHVTDSPTMERIRGRDGRTIADVWRGSPRAYLGTTIAGFPNLFMLLGPGTGLGHNSIVYMIESQIDYVLDALGKMRLHGIGAVEVKRETEAAYAAEIDRMLRGTVWLEGGCNSWYVDASGRGSTLWPRASWRFRRRTRRFVLAEYRLTPRQAVVPRSRQPMLAASLAD
jgi:cation diffusion facilitator CzcD-associated flavoprotein CzcO